MSSRVLFTIILLTHLVYFLPALVKAQQGSLSDPNIIIINNKNKAVENVRVSLYYESLCPYCADFIVNHLVKIFQNGLISIVNLKLIPWGNAQINPNGTFSCQHGPDECAFNAIDACTIFTYPNVSRHFRFIHCVEKLSLEGRLREWVNCFDLSSLGKEPVSCYKSGYGNQIERKFAKETAELKPPHKYVPWIVVNNQPLQEDYENFMSYICKAYRGKKPPACGSILSEIDTAFESSRIGGVCYI